MLPFLNRREVSAELKLLIFPGRNAWVGPDTGLRERHPLRNAGVL